jgi:3-methyladenine DNA glycosylase AlkD
LPFTETQLIDELKGLTSPENVAGQAHFGIRGANRLGVAIPELRRMAKGLKDHELAAGLWDSGIHDARILASMVDDPAQVTRLQMDAWVKDFDSWDLCDQVCSNLFDKTPYAVERGLAWVEMDEEYVRRAGFVMAAALAVHDKKLPDEVFRQFFEPMVKYAVDERNFVRKAINWALRQIGKCRPTLRAEIIELAQRIGQLDSPSARWIASDALRELSKKG